MPKKIIYCPDRYYHRDLCCYAQMNKTLIRRRFFVLWIQKCKRPLQTFVDMFIDYMLLFFGAWIKNLIQNLDHIINFLLDISYVVAIFELRLQYGIDFDNVRLQLHRCASSFSSCPNYHPQITMFFIFFDKE